MVVATIFLATHREEPVYLGKPLSFWVSKLGSDEYHGAPEEAVAAIRAIGPKAVPFLLEWMPHDGPQHYGAPQLSSPVSLAWCWQWCEEKLESVLAHKEKERPDPECLETAWWALGIEGKSAIPVLARVVNKSLSSRQDDSAWTHSAKAISYLGPEAVAPMLTALANVQEQHKLWQLIRNFENLGTNGAPVVPALLSWTNHPDYFVRAAVANALGGIGSRADLAVPALLAALHDSDSMVRRDAAEALGTFANDSEAVLPALIEILNGDDWEARGGALSGLGRIRSRSDTVVPLIVPYLSGSNSVIARSAAYALCNLGSRRGLIALLRSTNNYSGLDGIQDIIDRAGETISGEREERRRQDVTEKLAVTYAKGQTPNPTDLQIGGKSLSQILRSATVASQSLRLDQMLTLHQIDSGNEGDNVSFELPLSYDIVTNIGTLRLLCDADPDEKDGSEAMVQEFQRATNGCCRLVWNTSYDPPRRHFLQAELVVFRWHGHSGPENYIEQEIPFRGPLFSFLSTNSVQFFLHGNNYTAHGAFFRVKLAQNVGSYSLELTSPTGEHIHTLTGSTTNGIVEVWWDLRYDSNKRYTDTSFNATWNITFPVSP